MSQEVSVPTHVNINCKVTNSYPRRYSGVEAATVMAKIGNIKQCAALIPFSRCCSGSGTRWRRGIFLPLHGAGGKKKKKKSSTSPHGAFIFLCARFLLWPLPLLLPHRFHTSTVPLPHLNRPASTPHPLRFPISTVPLSHRNHSASAPLRSRTANVPLPHLNRSASTRQPFRLHTATTPLAHRNCSSSAPHVSTHALKLRIHTCGSPVLTEKIGI